MLTQSTPQFISVYGPVKSWRYRRSLGIDPIGRVSHCSFNCVYCQLGEIEKITKDRALFIPTKQIIEDLQKFAPWDVDVITFSGSGEPTLALNLGEILTQIKQITGKPTLVLTNGTLLHEPQVRAELAQSEQVSIKLDAVTDEQIRRVNRPVLGLSLSEILTGIKQFKLEYQGKLSIQTMILTPWHEETQQTYINLIQEIQPSEIQLNIPTRPKPLQRQLEGRGNQSPDDKLPYAVRIFKCVKAEVLQEISDRINQATGIPVRYAQI
jgi:wyosine [tRNA(Phe)-imidazoG37] synthetase (radical SAM superfamily)